MKIYNRKIGLDDPTYFIAEIGSNFDGSLDRARDLIKIAADSGADAAKYQHYTANTLVSDFGFASLEGTVKTHQSNWKSSVSDTYDKASLNREWTEALYKTAHDEGIGFFTSAYSHELVDYVEPWVDAYKIGSGDITFTEIIKQIILKDKPTLIATGASSLEEVENAMALFGSDHSNVCIMQCNTNYEGTDGNADYQNLLVLNQFKELYPSAVLGLSCHSRTWTSVIAAVTLGARIIEKHFTDDNTRTGPDHGFATTPGEWRKMVDETRLLERMLGDGKKKVEDNELMTVTVQQRAIRAKKDLAEGETILEEHLEALRPCPVDAIKPLDIQKVIGKKLLRGLRKGEHLTQDCFK